MVRSWNRHSQVIREAGADRPRRPPREHRTPIPRRSTKAVCTDQAVSYTHLDVYKRQVQRWPLWSTVGGRPSSGEEAFFDRSVGVGEDAGACAKDGTGDGDSVHGIEFRVDLTQGGGQVRGCTEDQVCLLYTSRCV